ncbi:MAG: acyl-CoA thioesterase [Verrucomicrobiaceae bacterium]|nr:acyl-CoA thioesterase [Verrucomicrobiaceae bacterium]
MTFVRFLALPLLTLALQLHAVTANDIPLAKAVECTPRAGLPNFYAKLEAGKEVNIGYLGGSITAQEGWRPKTLKMFQEAYPKAKISQINAAIGGTGSDLGVFRVKQDVLDHKPDLMFIEFAVNDGGAPPEQIYMCMEGIVRQTWKTLPDCDICFVYTLTEGLAKSMVGGEFQRSASAMEKIADHYGIPTIHMAMEVAKLAKEGKLIWKGDLPKTDEEKKALGDKIVFAKDGTHPYPETGHEFYLAAIKRSIPGVHAAGTKVGPHALGAPFIAGNYEQAKMVPITEATMSAGFTALDPKTDSIAKGFANRLPHLYRADKGGETLTFKFKGTRASIYDLVGPNCGQVIVTLDDQKPRTIARFDPYCTYHRLSALVIGSYLPDTVHTVKIEIHPDQPDKAKILAVNKNTIDNPKRYDGTAWYAGAIMLVGEMVK